MVIKSMFTLKQGTKRFFSVLALSACLVTGVSTISLAQSNSGLTLWSGVERENILNYHLDFGGRANQQDRYRLRIPAKKMESGASKFIITYPDYYDGSFDIDEIEVNFGNKYKQSAKVREVTWDKETQLIEIDLEEAIEPGNKVEIKLSNVQNPDFGGTYYFHCQVIGSDQFPVRLYLGTWIVSVDR